MSVIDELSPYIRAYPKAFRMARSRFGLTNEKLSERSGVPYSTVRNAQSGNGGVTIVQAAALARVLDLSIDEMFGAVRPEAEQQRAELEQRIRKVKHAINVFNATHVIPDFGMTIDEMLVYIPQLTQRKNKLADMKARLPKQRVEEQYGRQSNIIDYSYANYDLTAVEADYEKAADELSRAQLELDAVNQRDTFELEE